MATRSRSIRSSPWLKLLVVLLAASGMLVAVYGLLAGSSLELALQSSDYGQSSAKRGALYSIQDAVRQISQDYRSDQFITSGGTADPILNSEDSLPSMLRRDLEDLRSSYELRIGWARESGDLAEVSRLTAERDQALHEKQTELDRTLQESRAQLIAMDLAAYRSLQARLDEPHAYYYHSSIKGGGTLSNIGEAADVAAFFSELPASSSFHLPNGNLAYVGMTDQKYEILSLEYQSNRQAGTVGLYCVLLGLSVFMLCLGYIVNTAGVRSNSEQVALGSLDHLYLDVALAILFGLGTLCISLLVNLLDDYQSTQSETAIVLGAVLAVLLTLVTLLAGDMVSKRIKRRDALRHTLTYVGLSWLWRLFARFWKGTISRLMQAGPVSLRLLGLLVVQNVIGLLAFSLVFESYSSTLALFGLLLLLGTNALLMLYLLRKVTALRLISEGAARVGSGDLSHRIPPDTNPELAELARRVNQIAAGLGAAVDREVKAERMKAELVTNVSHDLKTPLTSIITYVDLLKAEGLTSEHAPRYLEVLDQKSQRLKTLTEDLFEAAKAASGSIALHLEQLDVASLVNQGLAELAEKIEASGLDFRVTLPPHKVYVQADGRLLWRVLENLLQNILKYALPGSRVYAEVTAQDRQVTIVLKNISASPLNVEPDELLERFKRGDESRHSEGSGLGLSIAKSLTELQGGTFRIQIDGDLFKATVVLPQSN